MDRIFRLLLVDDEPHVTGALSLQLEAREDLYVYIANSAAETLNVLRKTRIDLMVSDIRMPGMTGLELLSRVQKEQPDCKVILLTGYADFNYVYEAMRQGAAGYVLKNESDETLLEQIDKVLSEIRKEEQTRRLLHTVLTEEKQEPKSVISVQRAVSLPEPQEGQCGTLLYLADGRKMPPGLLNLIPRYFQEELEGWALLRSESGALFHRLVWKRVRPLSWYSSVLERLQGALAESCGLKLSILLSPLPGRRTDTAGSPAPDGRSLRHPQGGRLGRTLCLYPEPARGTGRQPLQAAANLYPQPFEGRSESDPAGQYHRLQRRLPQPYVPPGDRRTHWPLYRGLQIGAAAEPSAGPGYDHRTGRVGGGLYLPLLFQPLCAPGNRHVAQFFPGNATGRSQIGKSV